MNKFKFYTWLMGAGALAGAVVGTFVAVRFVPWYNTPGGTGEALCPCGENSRNTADALINGQLTGIAVGAVLIPLVVWILKRAFGGRAEAHSVPASRPGDGPAQSP